MSDKPIFSRLLLMPKKARILTKSGPTYKFVGTSQRLKVKPEAVLDLQNIGVRIGQ